MKKLQLIATKTLISFDEFITRNRFQFPNGVYQSHNHDVFHLSFVNPIFEKILFLNTICERIKLPENYGVEKYRLMHPASCMEIRSEIGYEKTFTMQTFLATVWSLLFEQGENVTGFINKNCLYIFNIKYPDGTFKTATMMLQNIGAYYEYSINIHSPKIYEDTWSVSNQEDRSTYLLVPINDQKN